MKDLVLASYELKQEEQREEAEDVLHLRGNPNPQIGVSLEAPRDASLNRSIKPLYLFDIQRCKYPKYLNRYQGLSATPGLALATGHVYCDR